jgi:hypothetical protein
MKVSRKFLKSLKENKNKKGIEKVIAVKVKDFDREFLLSKQTITISHKGWVIKKLDATSMFGHYRIIVARDLNSKKVIYDFYFKNNKTDLDHQEIEDLKNFILECEDDNFYNELSDFTI